ncbi:hypothetical protein [Actinoplanes sp. NBRC 101535]|uniref:hypothetical protein n=1 Tax=Actinoplanes sp. NBRC 101535 TaxID=3032196 RepID=UPI0024A2EC08|nr:hypothetical protein [Actinoplanes sp. NBRC 101535]GLY08239.1 hypothetical protein Acsp01_86180 [Actinoplanes sp. NBRC 101535]
MPEVADFIIHPAAAPQDDGIQCCTTCGSLIIDNTAWYQGRVQIPEGQPDTGPAWWPEGALIATNRHHGTSPVMSYRVEGRPPAADEQLCETPHS